PRAIRRISVPTGLIVEQMLSDQLHYVVGELRILKVEALGPLGGQTEETGVGLAVRTARTGMLRRKNADLPEQGPLAHLLADLRQRYLALLDVVEGARRISFPEQDLSLVRALVGHVR